MCVWGGFSLKVQLHRFVFISSIVVPVQIDNQWVYWSNCCKVPITRQKRSCSWHHIVQGLLPIMSTVDNLKRKNYSISQF